MTDELALMNDLRSSDQDVRLEAQAGLARRLREERAPAAALNRGMKLAPHAVTERQRRVFSALLGDITTAQTSVLLIAEGDNEGIHGTVARRAFRRFCDHALPPDEAAALSQALEWCVRNRASEQLVNFLCERIVEAAVKRPTVELCGVHSNLETIVRWQGRSVFGSRSVKGRYAETLAAMRPLLPDATLPLPSHRPAADSRDNLPRPTDNRETSAKNLPLAEPAKNEQGRRGTRGRR